MLEESGKDFLSNQNHRHWDKEALFGCRLAAALAEYIDEGRDEDSTPKRDIKHGKTVREIMKMYKCQLDGTATPFP